MKIFYFDVETTGVMHWKNGIHQISGIIEIDGEVKDRFNYLVRPNEKALIDAKALEIGRVTVAQLATYPPMSEVHTKLKRKLAQYVDQYKKEDKFFICGYNCASFDSNFLRAFFVQCGDPYFGSFFWSATLDVIVLAMEHLKHKRHLMKDFKLHTVALELGIEVDEKKLHDAMYDIELTRNIYQLIQTK